MVLAVGTLMTAIQTRAEAQRRRTTAVFDADTLTRPGAGMYGIGVRDGQPWLVSNTGDAKRIVVEDKYVVGVQLNANGDIEFPGGSYQGQRTQLVSLNKDSLTVTLPNPRDTINENRNISFVYWGFSGSLFSYYDATYAVRFSDTVFAYNGSTYFWLPNTWIGSMTTEPTSIARNIKPGGGFVLSEMDRRWYIHFNGVEY